MIRLIDDWDRDVIKSVGYSSGTERLQTNWSVFGRVDDVLSPEL
jgi:hypothetical protein